MFPKERELVIDIIEAMQDDEPDEGFITFRNFHREMLKILSERLYEPVSADVLLQAFRTLDLNNVGYIEGEMMERLLVTKGEAFRQQELDDFFAIACDSESGRIYYEDYVNLATRDRN